MQFEGFTVIKIHTPLQDLYMVAGHVCDETGGHAVFLDNIPVFNDEESAVECAKGLAAQAAEEFQERMMRAAPTETVQ